MTKDLTDEEMAEALLIAAKHCEFLGDVPLRLLSVDSHSLLCRALLQAQRDASKYKRLSSVRHIELRRLNKYLGPYWAGFRRGMDMESTCKLRGIMNSAFGHEKVRAAEHAAIGASISKDAK